jgi:hypothetical protein
MPHRITALRPSRAPRALTIALAALSLLAGCADPAGTARLGTEGAREVPRFRITGVEVRAIDRRQEGQLTHYFWADTLRQLVQFEVRAAFERLPAEGGAAAADPLATDPYPGDIVNPTVRERNSIVLDRPVVHRGVEIPVGTNLVAVEAIRDSFDGSMSDLLHSGPSPFAVTAVAFRLRAFEFARGPHTFTFRWETAEGEAFTDSVSVFIDLQ